LNSLFAQLNKFAQTLETDHPINEEIQSIIIHFFDETLINKMSEQGLDMTTSQNFTAFYDHCLQKNIMYLLVKKKERSTIKEFIHFFAFLKKNQIKVETSQKLQTLVLERLLLGDNIKKAQLEIEGIICPLK
jgi:uncharacterized SAM-dependent methyltransferase